MWPSPNTMGDASPQALPQLPVELVGFPGDQHALRRTELPSVEMHAAFIPVSESAKYQVNTQSREIAS